MNKDRNINIEEFKQIAKEMERLKLTVDEIKRTTGYKQTATLKYLKRD